MGSGQERRTSIGGQALIEGVMMRGTKKTTMAVRHLSTGEIVTESWPTATSTRAAWTKWPFVRGVFAFYDSMKAGYSALMKSTELSGYTEWEEAEEAAKKEKKAGKKAQSASATEEAPTLANTTTDDTVAAADQKTETQPEEKKENQVLMTVLMVISAILGVLLAVALFMFLPSFLYNQLKKLAPDVLENRFLQSLFEGIFKIAIFVIYVAATSLMKDIHRVYMYHGAEHKTIFCYEHGLPLTVENVRIQRRFHPRCGTSFLILMLIIGIFIGMLVPTTIPTALRVGIRILLIPLAVSIGYEAIKLCGRKDNTFTRIISAPGMWLQHVTTKEPDDQMIECAITAFLDVVPEDESEDRW